MDWEATNFTKEEFNCQCGCVMPNSVEVNVLLLVEQLQKLRQHLGKPIKITSGYRCAKHNKKVGGASLSTHVPGKAADFKVEGFTGEMLRGYVEALIRTKVIKNGGMGTYSGLPNILHYDLRPEPSRWRD